MELITDIEYYIENYDSILKLYESKMQAIGVESLSIVISDDKELEKYVSLSIENMSRYDNGMNCRCISIMHFNQETCDYTFYILYKENDTIKQLENDKFEIRDTVYERDVTVVAAPDTFEESLRRERKHNEQSNQDKNNWSYN